VASGWRPIGSTVSRYQVTQAPRVLVPPNQACPPRELYGISPTAAVKLKSAGLPARQIGAGHTGLPCPDACPSPHQSSGRMRRSLELQHSGESVKIGGLTVCEQAGQLWSWCQWQSQGLQSAGRVPPKAVPA